PRPRSATARADSASSRFAARRRRCPCSRSPSGVSASRLACERTVEVRAAIAEEAHARAGALELVEIEGRRDDAFLDAIHLGELLAAVVADEGAAVERDRAGALALGAGAIGGDDADLIGDGVTDHHALPRILA